MSGPWLPGLLQTLGVAWHRALSVTGEEHRRRSCRHVARPANPLVLCYFTSLM